MKKILYLGFIIIAFGLVSSCTHSTDPTPTPTPTPIPTPFVVSPPAWLIGTWSVTTGSLSLAYTFTDDSIVNVNVLNGTTTTTINFNQSFKTCTVEVHASSDTLYDISIILNGNAIGRYSFEFVDATSLEYEVSTPPNPPVSTIILEKQ